jgi:hypothetical protein
MSNEPTEMSASPETRTKAAEELADRYLALWNDRDADRRRRTIAELLSGTHAGQMAASSFPSRPTCSALAASTSLSAGSR